ncbi:RNA polymerase sigma factor [Paenibacillus sp. SI8]|uniref:RNA polymerase sigma factor n=1 Tax=unclassified Paenibacillus TaxID=185978 RepID=UPI003465FD50
MDIQKLYSSYKQDLLSYLLKIAKNRQDAEDLLQECFIRFMSASPLLPNDKIFFYLKKIARNLAIDMFRKRKKKRDYTMYLNELPCHWDAHDFEHQEEVNRILRMVSNVEHRTIVDLRLVQGFSTKETAKIVDKTENTVKTSLFRGVNHIKTRYSS